MIKLIQARWYKCLRCVDVLLEPFQILVGPNASGKSTLLDVPEFLKDFLTGGLEFAVQKRGKRFADLVWQGEGDSFALAVELAVPSLLRQERGIQYPFCRYELHIGKSGGQGSAAILAENFFLLPELSLSAGVRPDFFGQDVSQPGEIVVQRGHRTPRGWRPVVRQTGEGRVYIRSEKTEWNFSGRPAAGKSGLTIVPQEVERFPITTWAYEFLLHRVYRLALQGGRMREPCHPEAPEVLEPDGSNLPQLVRRLKKDEVRFERWLKHVRTVLPLTNVDVQEREADRHLYLVTHWASGLRIPSWLLSEGTLRMLALTALAYLPLPEAMYLIEEPENGIHPQALETVFQSLSSSYDSQVCVATHSPLLLQLADLEDILCFTLTPAGATSVVRGSEHPRLREWRGKIDVAELFAAGVLG